MVLYDGIMLGMQVMMLNDKLQSPRALQSALRKAEQYLLSIPADTPYSEFNNRYVDLHLLCDH